VVAHGSGEQAGVLVFELASALVGVVAYQDTGSGTTTRVGPGEGVRSVLRSTAGTR